MSMYGIDVDAGGIARGIWDMMDANERTGVAFGLFPAHVVNTLENGLRQWFDEQAARQVAAKCGMSVEDVMVVAKQVGRGPANIEMREAWVRHTSRAVTLALLACADPKGVTA